MMGCGSSSLVQPVTLTGPSVAADGSLNRVTLAVWGDSPTSVYFVGGGRGVVNNGTPIPGLFMHWDGKDFTELGAVDPTFWWVHGFSANDVWAAGEKGSIAHWDGTKITVVTNLITATLAGLWGSSSSDLWAVGGTLGNEPGENDVILHCTGSCDQAGSWKKIDPPMKTNLAYFKIWGAAANDIYLVGLGGLIAHYDGSMWKPQNSGVGVTSLLTVNGSAANDVYAVGGPPGGVLLHSTDGGVTWTKDTTQPFSNGLVGVFAHPSGRLVVTGLNGQKYVRDGGVWKDYTDQAPLYTDLHAVWLDSTGKTGFMVGGNYTTPPEKTDHRTGIIARIGSSIGTAAVKGP